MDRPSQRSQRLLEHARGTRYLVHLVRTVRLSVVAVVAAALALTGCAMTEAVDGSCVPRMQVEPATVHLGDSFTVVSADNCNVTVTDGGWVVVAGHVGDEKALVDVRSSDTFDGAFRVKLNLPSDFPLGEAYAGVDSWDYSTCADPVSCAGPMVNFTVER